MFWIEKETSCAKFFKCVKSGLVSQQYLFSTLSIPLAIRLPALNL